MEKVKEVYRKVMVVNYLDVGGSYFLVFKINEVKDVMFGKIKGSGFFF